MNSVIDKLVSYGIKQQEVMERFGNDEDFYIKCFKAFMEDTTFDKLMDSFEKADYIMVFDYAHTLKGVAGNLGLISFYNILCDFVESLRNKEYTDLTNQYKKIQDERTKLMNLLMS